MWTHCWVHYERNLNEWLMSRIQYWTSKINNIVKEIRDIKNTFKGRKNNQNSPVYRPIFRAYQITGRSLPAFLSLDHLSEACTSPFEYPEAFLAWSHPSFTFHTTSTPPPDFSCPSLHSDDTSYHVYGLPVSLFALFSIFETTLSLFQVPIISFPFWFDIFPRLLRLSRE